MSVSSYWRSSGSLVVVPRDYVKSYVMAAVIMVSGYQILIPGYHNLVPALMMTG